MRSEPSLPAGTTFNHYGQTVRPYWHRWLPQRLTGLDNPEAFFTEPADQAPERITTKNQALCHLAFWPPEDPAPPTGRLASAVRRHAKAAGTRADTGAATGPDIGDGRGAMRWR